MTWVKAVVLIGFFDFLQHLQLARHNSAPICHQNSDDNRNSKFQELYAHSNDRYATLKLYRVRGNRTHPPE